MTQERCGQLHTPIVGLKIVLALLHGDASILSSIVLHLSKDFTEG